METPSVRLPGSRHVVCVDAGRETPASVRHTRDVHHELRSACTYERTCSVSGVRCREGMALAERAAMRDAVQLAGLHE